MVADTSIEAYEKLKEENKISPQMVIVFDSILKFKNDYGRWPTDREICWRSGLDKNVVTGRRNSLVKLGIVSKSLKIKDKMTGCTVNTWQIIHP